MIEHNELLLKELEIRGCLGGSAVEHLPLAYGVISESRDGVPYQAPCMGPASPSAMSLPLCLYLS